MMFHVDGIQTLMPASGFVSIDYCTELDVLDLSVFIMGVSINWIIALFSAQVNVNALWRSVK